MRHVMRFGCTACLLAFAWAQAAGPDVIVGDLEAPVEYARNATVAGVAFGTISCNTGDAKLEWRALPDSRHPVIAMNMYRLRDDRMEQIGRSWVKHGYFALQGDVCGFGCQAPLTGAGNALYPGCSDPYGATLNHNRDVLGPRNRIDPTDGRFDPASALALPDPEHNNPLSRGMHIRHSDLGNPNARYFIEGHYIAADDAAAGNDTNNVSYREVKVSNSGTEWVFDFIGTPTQRRQTAISVWPGATLVPIQDDQGDGKIVVGYKVTDLGGGRFRYNYVIYNMNSRRAIGTLQIPIGNANVSDIGFHAPPQNDDRWTSDPWAGSTADGQVMWGTQNFAANPNANAVRWGTAYTFWFVADRPPQQASATLQKFAPGNGPSSISVAVSVPR